MKQIITIMILSVLSLNAFSLNIAIFTDTAHPVSIKNTNNNQTEYYNLDDLNGLLQTMNEAVKGQNHVNAINSAKAIINKLHLKIQHAVQGIQLVHQYHIKTIPTIVFGNNDYQIHGQTDLIKAIQEYKIVNEKNNDEKN